MKIKIGIDLSLMRYGNLQNETPMNILFSAIDFKTMTLNYNHSSSGNKLFYINGSWDRQPEKVSPYSKYDLQTIQLTVIDNEVEKRFKSLHLSAEQQS